MGSVSCRESPVQKVQQADSSPQITPLRYAQDLPLFPEISRSIGKESLHPPSPPGQDASAKSTVAMYKGPPMASEMLPDRRPPQQVAEVIQISDDEDDDDDGMSEGFHSSLDFEVYASPQILNHSKESQGGSKLTTQADDKMTGFAQREEWEEWSSFFPDGNNDMTQDTEIRRAIMNELGAGSYSESMDNDLDAPAVSDDPISAKVQCVDSVLMLFPDICRDYVSGLYEFFAGSGAERLIASILDKVESGEQYPKAKDKIKSLKRKREVEEEDEASTKYGSVDRERGSHDYQVLTRTILQGEFSQTPMSFIDATLKQTNHHLFPAYRILEEADRTWDPARPPYNKIKHARKLNHHYRPDFAEAALKSQTTSPPLMLALQELQLARRARKKVLDKIQAERQIALEEEENFRKAHAEGTMNECGCCFSDFPLNRMVHCDNPSLMHWFCRSCAKQTAETEIGNSKYEIHCMSMDGCDFGFSKDQKTQFLDDKTLIALDRNEQEAMLRMAGIENLASCPFCPFAAEYPPVEEDRLFRCQAPDCEKISCRLCRLESHIPKSCEEHAKDNGLSIRRQIEEAMSAALIRTCNKCKTPFVKEEGCNKMTCIRNACFNVQCYICSKSCTYDHFDDRKRGGKSGNCPLFENVEERHEQEVNQAEKAALEKVRAEHPQYTEEDLKIKVSENVKKDEEKRRVTEPRLQNHFNARRHYHQFDGPIEGLVHVQHPAGLEHDPFPRMQRNDAANAINRQDPLFEFRMLRPQELIAFIQRGPVPAPLIDPMHHQQIPPPNIHGPQRLQHQSVIAGPQPQPLQDPNAPARHLWDDMAILRDVAHEDVRRAGQLEQAHHLAQVRNRGHVPDAPHHPPIPVRYKQAGRRGR